MELKEQIILESHQLFYQYGAKSVTMDDIARHLGISKKTLYKYFTKKDELVETITRYSMKLSEEECVLCAEKADNAIHELFMTMDIIRKQFKGMNPSLVYDLQKYYKKAWDIIEEHENEFVVKLLVDNLERGIAAGLYREDINIGILAKLRIEEMKMCFNEEIFSSQDYNIGELHIILLEHFMLGITTIEGHQLANDYHKKLKQ